MSLLDAAECYPAQTWKLWERTHPRDYNEDSEVCGAVSAELSIQDLVSSQLLARCE